MVDDVVTGWWRTFSVHSFFGLIHCEIVPVLISCALNIGVSKGGADKNLDQLGPERGPHGLHDRSEDEGARSGLPLQELQGGGARHGHFPRDDTLMGDRQRAQPARRRLYLPRRLRQGGRRDRGRREAAQGRRGARIGVRGNAGRADPPAQARERHSEGHGGGFKRRGPRPSYEQRDDGPDRMAEAGGRPPLKRAHRFLEDIEELL